MAQPIAPNLSWLLDDVATGGDLAYDLNVALAQRDAIIELGITHIFDARIEDNDEDMWVDRADYVNVPVNDAIGTRLPASFFDRAVLFARRARREGGKILLHCHMGINRGPSAAVAVLMDRGMAPIEALRLILDRRPIAGVYYFMDAYDAHVARNGLTPDPKVRAQIQAQWVAMTRTPVHIKRVNGAIRAHNVAEDKMRRAIWDSMK